jgi:chemotaxis protein histidine kinase CheA
MADFSDPFPISEPLDLVELQLQQELQAMFDIDSQRYLQDYLHLTQQLNAPSWTADMQEMYRAIHTIKGGAVTVGAEACLKVATVLEDLLSDLRHLTPAPPLGDGQLANLLQEAGELLASSLRIQGTWEAIADLVNPSVQRIQTLHEQIKVTYLADWNDQRLLHQEFAEQGFGLVILNLEMAVEQLSIPGNVPAEAMEIATQTLVQLAEIGHDLEFAGGWIELLGRCDALVNEPSTALWRSQWPGYLAALQESARQSGKWIEPIFTPLPTVDVSAISAVEPPVPAESPLLDLDLTSPALENVSLELEGLELESIAQDLPGLEDFTSDTIGWVPPNIDSIELNPAIDSSEWTELELPNFEETLAAEDLPSLADPLDIEIHDEFPINLENFDLDLSLEAINTLEQWQEFTPILEEDPAQINLPSSSDRIEPEAALSISDDWANLEDLSGLDDLSDLDNLGNLADWIDAPLGEASESVSDLNPTALQVEPDWLGLVSPDPRQEATEAATTERDDQPSVRRTEIEGTVQVPVPLDRLDQTAQTLVETLLSVRVSQGLYGNLQSQLVQLLALAQESAQNITELRKLQDNFALLNDLRLKQQDTDSPALERYREGYSTINRLLETSLRLSEVGAEASKSVQQTSNSLKALDRNVLRLRQNIEQSRLVPFKNLGFRAKAVLRDLSTRMGKPAQMVVEGEHIELDAATASRLEPALLHLIRNAYDHGLESAADRAASGKSAQGTITLSLRRSGNRYLLDIKDDGRGIDAAHIQQVAVAKGLPLTQTDTTNQLLSVLCQPGFSSQSVVSDISGRGVGMDVVAHQIESLGGRLQLETVVEQGSKFQLQFPVPQLLVSCVLLQVGDRSFAIPAQDIATTTLWDRLETVAVTESNCPYSWQIKQGEALIPGLDLSQYWQPQSTNRTIPETAVALRIRSTEQSQSLWILADDLREQTELLITPLPNPLQAPVGVLGVSLQSDGNLVPVIDAAILVEAITTSQNALSSAPLHPLADTSNAAEISFSSASRTILVVDDAALMRRRIEASLTAYGYTIVTCADGQEAWNWLQQHPAPAMVITDIEMPNMDGFTLIDRARQSGLTMPMVIVSSRLAEEWSKEARRLGATDYLTKGFTTQELIAKVRSLL